MNSRSSKPQAVLFDLDGTLLDTAPDFHLAINRLRDEQGLAPIDYTTIRQRVSDGAAALIETAFDITPENPGFKPLHQRLLDLYEAGIAEQSRPFEGIDTLLQWLEQEQIPWGIVTNKPVRFTAPLLDAIGWSQRCGAAICPDHVQQRKPHPESLLLACQQLDRTPEQCIYIGDHQRDIEAGQRAKMQTVAATYGYLSENTNPHDWQADFLAASPADILGWISTTTV